MQVLQEQTPAMVHEGCRKIADTFNRLYEDKRQMTVGKTFVYNTIQAHRYEIYVLRKKMKNKRPRVLPKNLIWSMDLTQVSDTHTQAHCIFGVVDSGTRACLLLRELPTKTSMILLRCLLDTIENYGKPKAIRTDNEAVFTSRLFRLGLWVLNIKHQRTEVCCPWMNGKIERFIYKDVMYAGFAGAKTCLWNTKAETTALFDSLGRNTG